MARRAEQAPGVVGVRLSGDSADLDAMADLLAGLPGAEVLSRSAGRPNRYQPGRARVPDHPDHPAEHRRCIMTGRTYTHPDVFTLGVTQGWAEAETDPTRINWPERQARAAIPFEVIDGRPVNPCEQTGIRYGRNEMGFWGEQLMADALVTFTTAGGGFRWMLLVERGDGYGWAVPGGHVEPGETGPAAALRELAEETGLAVPAAAATALAPRYVPDPRSSDEAWAVTVPVAIDLGRHPVMPEVTGGDDARRAEWVPANDYAELVSFLDRCYSGSVFAAHVDMLGDFLRAPVAGSPR